MIESLWDSVSFFKLIYGQKFINSKEAREKMMKEHDSYLNALKEKDSGKIYQLLWKNLSSRTEDIPYDASAYFEE